MRASREVPVGPCEPWCESSPDEHQHDHPADRRCIRRTDGVKLSLHQALLMTNGEYWSDGLNVRLWRDTGAATEVQLHHEGTDEEIRLTLTEAHQLADTLQALLRSSELTNG